MPQRRTNTPVATICQGCSISFLVKPSELLRGNGKFCSKACVGANMPKRDLAERFWEKVNKYGPTPAHRPELGPCWLWTAQRLKGGYGRFCRKTRKMALAHRIAWKLTRGLISPGLELDHLCVNPPCVNPSHLEAVTPLVNIMRSSNPTATNSSKTHCKHGHKFTPENTRIRIDRPGTRECLACERSRCRRKTSRKAA